MKRLGTTGITIGMTVAEVEDLFSFGPGSIPQPPPDSVDLVTGGDEVITITFSDGRVTGKQWHDPREHWLNKVVRWLHLN
jgi:hypothetical protein